MKKIFICLVLFILTILIVGMGEAPKERVREKPKTEQYFFYLIDDFEELDPDKAPKWWKFDNIILSIASNRDLRQGDPMVISTVADYSMHIKGSAKDWYVGGCGTYLGIDATKYNFFQLDVYGTGRDSGKLRIELYDDDNGNWQIESDPKKGYTPFYDDKWVYEIEINWIGWERVMIPVMDFTPANPSVGDSIWNPDQKGGSGGLIQIQLIAIASREKGKVDFNVDNIKLVKAGQLK